MLPPKLKKANVNNINIVVTPEYQQLCRYNKNRPNEIHFDVMCMFLKDIN